MIFVWISVFNILSSRIKSNIKNISMIDQSNNSCDKAIPLYVSRENQEDTVKLSSSDRLLSITKDFVNLGES